MRELTWRDLEFSLARHLASMDDDAIFTLYVDEQQRAGFDPDLDGYPRYVQFCVYDAAWVRCEVVSNTYLPEDMRHTLDDLIAMRADGWTMPEDEHVSGSPNIFFDVEVSDADRAAAMVVRVFRNVWGLREAVGVTCDADALRGPDAFRVWSAPADFRSFDPVD